MKVVYLQKYQFYARKAGDSDCAIYDILERVRCSLIESQPQPVRWPGPSQIRMYGFRMMLIANLGATMVTSFSALSLSLSPSLSLPLSRGIKKKRGEATAHRCILRCLTQPAFESGNPTHALNMLRSLEVITTTHCTVFVLPRLLICLTKHALGLALSLPDCGPQPDVHGVSHDENRRCF